MQGEKEVELVCRARKVHDCSNMSIRAIHTSNLAFLSTAS